MASCLEAIPRPPSRNCATVLSARGAPRSARGPGAVRSLSPALQIAQKNVLPDAPRALDAPRGNRPREYLSALHAGSQGIRTATSELKNMVMNSEPLTDQPQSPIDVAVAAFDTVQSSVRCWPDNTSLASSNAQSRPPSARRSRTPDHQGDSRRDNSQTRPGSARRRRATSAEPAKPPAVPQLRAAEVSSTPTLWPTDRAQRGPSLEPVTSAKSNQCQFDDSMDALDALVAELNEQMSKPDQSSNMSRPTKTKGGCQPERKCGIAPTRRKQTWLPQAFPSASFSYQESVEVETTPSVYCSPSATLMSVQYPGSPIPKAIDFDDTDTSVVLLTGRPMSARLQRVRFECHGTSAQAHVPQAPGRRFNATGAKPTRPLGCTLVAFGGA